MRLFFPGVGDLLISCRQPHRTESQTSAKLFGIARNRLPLKSVSDLVTLRIAFLDHNARRPDLHRKRLWSLWCEIYAEASLAAFLYYSMPICGLE